MSIQLAQTMYVAGRRLEQIFIKIPWLVRSRSRMTPIVLGKNWPPELDMRKLQPENYFFGYNADSIACLDEKKVMTVFRTSFPRKKIVLIFVV